MPRHHASTSARPWGSIVGNVIARSMATFRRGPAPYDGRCKLRTVLTAVLASSVPSLLRYSQAPYRLAGEHWAGGVEMAVDRRAVGRQHGLGVDGAAHVHDVRAPRVEPTA